MSPPILFLVGPCVKGTILSHVEMSTYCSIYINADIGYQWFQAQ